MYEFDDLAGVEAILRRLAERTPPLATELPRRSGEKENRFAHLLCGEVVLPEVDLPVPARSSLLEERVIRLENDLTELRREFEEFRSNFE